MNNKINVQDKTAAIEPSESAQGGSRALFEIAIIGAGDPKVALEALLLAACEIVVHNDGNVNQNMEAARQQLAGLLEYSKVKHAACIEDLKAQGIQYDEVH